MASENPVLNFVEYMKGVGDSAVNMAKEGAYGVYDFGQVAVGGTKIAAKEGLSALGMDGAASRISIDDIEPLSSLGKAAAQGGYSGLGNAVKSMPGNMANAVADAVRQGDMRALGSSVTDAVLMAEGARAGVAGAAKGLGKAAGAATEAAEKAKAALGKAKASGNPEVANQAVATCGKNKNPKAVNQTKPKFSGDWKNYKTKGLEVDPENTPEGKRLIAEFEKKGLDTEDAIMETKELLKTGSSLPLANPIEVSDTFYKVIPQGSSVGPNSAFWATEQEITKLKGLNYDQIADKLGLPLASQQGSTFEVVSIKALSPGTSFTSVIAPTTELGANGALWSQSGGGLQTLIVDRSTFSVPTKTGIKLP